MGIWSLWDFGAFFAGPSSTCSHGARSQHCGDAAQRLHPAFDQRIGTRRHFVQWHGWAGHNLAGLQRASWYCECFLLDLFDKLFINLFHFSQLVLAKSDDHDIWSDSLEVLCNVAGRRENHNVTWMFAENGMEETLFQMSRSPNQEKRRVSRNWKSNGMRVSNNIF